MFGLKRREGMRRKHNRQSTLASKSIDLGGRVGLGKKEMSSPNVNKYAQQYGFVNVKWKNRVIKKSREKRILEKYFHQAQRNLQEIVQGNSHLHWGKAEK